MYMVHQIAAANAQNKDIMYQQVVLSERENSYL